MEEVKDKELGLMLKNNISMFLDTARFEFAQRVAGMFAKSSMVPAHFQNNVGNCMIALNLAERMQVDPFMLMQNLYIVHGRPGIESKLAIALVNSSGRFDPIQYEFTGDKDSRACRAFAKEIKTGNVLYGPLVSWQMAKAEGWVDKDRSKWKTMPDLMFMYRSAMYFARVYDPGALLGLRTKDELDDMVIEMAPAPKTTASDIPEGVDIYAIKGSPVTPSTPATPEPTPAKRGRSEGSKNRPKTTEKPPEPQQEALLKPEGNDTGAQAEESDFIKKAMAYKEVLESVDWKIVCRNCGAPDEDLSKITSEKAQVYFLTQCQQLVDLANKE